MNPTRLSSELRIRPVLCDGGMGTQLMARGMAAGECGERWNLERPGEVEAIHRSYIEAGCELVTTNTFGGTSSALERHGLAERAAEVNRAGAAAAKRAAGDRATVLGDIGPFGGFLEPVGDTAEQELFRIFQQQARALCAGGADVVIVETMSDPAELALAVRAALSVNEWPVIATYAFGKPGGQFRTLMGTTVPEAMEAAIAAGATAVGANCGTALALSDYVRLAQELTAAAGDVPVILQPNAGTPRMVEGRLVYDATPEQMAAIVPDLLSAGVRIIGGCCGTGPEHLRAMRAALDAARRR
jgi:5-methyltetrahydrofolate--homocysteine methyltransferase